MKGGWGEVKRAPYFDYDKACTGTVGAAEVDIGLVGGDVEALDTGTGDPGEGHGHDSSRKLHS